MTAFERRNVKAKKLTPTQVAEIKERYANGETQGSLCRAYAMSVGQIGRIVRGESWSHLGGAVVTQEDAEASKVRFLAMQKSLSALEAASVPTQGEEAETALRALRPPPSPLDDGDAPSEGEGALSVLERQARAMGADIDKLRGEKP